MTDFQNSGFDKYRIVLWIAIVMFAALGGFIVWSGVNTPENDNVDDRQNFFGNAAGQGEWLTFQGDRAHSGKTQFGFTGGMKLEWTFEAGSAVNSSAVIYDGDGNDIPPLVVVATEKGSVCGIDLDSGEKLWRQETGNAVSAPLSIGGAVVYVPDESGNVFAFNLRDGSEVWRRKLGDGEKIVGAPLVTDSSVIVGSYDGNLYALSLTDGNVLWNFDINMPVHASPASDGKLAYISGCDGWLRGIGIEDGKERLSVELGGYIAAAPTLAGGIAVICGHNGRIFVVDLALGKVKWNTAKRYTDPIEASVAVSHGKLVVADLDGRLMCLELDSGIEIWLKKLQTKFRSSPILWGAEGVIAGDDGKIRIFNTEDGSERWTFDAGAGISSTAAVAMNRIVIGASDGAVYCFSPSGLIK